MSLNWPDYSNMQNIIEVLNQFKTTGEIKIIDTCRVSPDFLLHRLLIDGDAYYLCQADYIYNDEELNKAATCSKMEQVQMEGNRKVKRIKEYYNLDMIISIGFRVNSKKAIKFRSFEESSCRI